MMPYSVHVAVILAVCLGFYKFLLGNHTYYRLNRLVLLACLFGSFLLPLIKVPQRFVIFTKNLAVRQVYTEAVNAARAMPASAAVETIAPTNAIRWFGWVYWFGAMAFGVNFLVQVAMLLYQSYNKQSIVDGRYKIVELETDKAPCSFGNYIFINPAKYEWDTYNRILIHEKIHVREHHTIDLVMCELMLVFQWFNFFAWLYRKAVENNLEFLTDDAVVNEHKIDAAAYQLSLLQVSVPNYAVRLATSYNQSLLKKRIMMMDAKRSNVHTLWKYIMLLPVLIALVLLFNPTITQPDLKAAQPMAYKFTKQKQKTLPITMATDRRPVKNKTETSVVASVDTPKHSYEQNTETTDDPLYEKKPVDRLLILQSYGIDIDYVNGFRDIGYPSLTLTEVRQLHSRGITVAYVKGFVELGCDQLTIADIIALHSRSISPEYLKTFVDNGYKGLTASDLIKLKAHGIKAGPKPF